MVSDPEQAKQSSATPAASTLALQISIQTAELAGRMRDRLAGLATPAASSVVWQRDGRQVLLDLDSLVVRTIEGWLLCNLDAHSDQTATTTLQFVFYLGSADEGAGVQAAATINAPALPAAQLADAWGQDLQRVLWDAVLDVVEASVQHAADANPGAPLTLGGFHCDPDAIAVDVLVEEV